MVSVVLIGSALLLRLPASRRRRRRRSRRRRRPRRPRPRRRLRRRSSSSRRSSLVRRAVVVVLVFVVVVGFAAGGRGRLRSSPLGEVAEDVVEGLRVAAELEQDPALLHDQRKISARRSRAVRADELEAVRACRRSGSSLTCCTPAASLSASWTSCGRRLARRRGSRRCPRDLLLVDRDDVADPAALGADLVERAVGDDAALARR